MIDVISPHRKIKCAGREPWGTSRFLFPSKPNLVLGEDGLNFTIKNIKRLRDLVYIVIQATKREVASMLFISHRFKANPFNHIYVRSPETVSQYLQVHFNQFCVNSGGREPTFHFSSGCSFMSCANRQASVIGLSESDTLDWRSDASL